MPLPAIRFELAEHRTATVQFNYHTAVDQMYYSVPYQYIKDKVDVRMTDTTIEVFKSHRKLDQIYRSSDYLTRDKLSLISDILAPEYQDKTSKRFNNRMKTAKLIGTPCDIRKCTE